MIRFSVDVADVNIRPRTHLINAWCSTSCQHLVEPLCQSVVGRTGEAFKNESMLSMPCLLTAWGVAHGRRNSHGQLDPTQEYMLSPLSFLCQAFWLELWLRVAAPISTDHASLPRRFRQVLLIERHGGGEDRSGRRRR